MIIYILLNFLFFLTTPRTVIILLLGITYVVYKYFILVINSFFTIPTRDFVLFRIRESYIRQVFNSLACTYMYLYINGLKILSPTPLNLDECKLLSIFAIFYDYTYIILLLLLCLKKYITGGRVKK